MATPRDLPFSSAGLRRWSAAALVWGMACDSPPEIQSRAFVPQVRDSGGVRLVEYSGLGPMPSRSTSRAVNPLLPQLSQFVPKVKMDSQPFLRLGGLSEREDLEFDPRHFTLSVIELTSGTLVVMDRTRLAFYDQKGRLLRVTGGAGRGPGEFQQTGQICALSGDTISVIDFVDERITLWDRNGEHLATYARPGTVVYGGCHPSGYVVVREPGPLGTIRDTLDQMTRYHLVSPSGELIQNLGLHPGVVRGYPVPRPMLIHAGDRFVFGNGRTFEIRTYNRSAELAQVTRLLRHRDVISDDDWDAQIRMTIPMNATPAQARATRERMTQQRPHRLPAFGALRFDPHGRLWVSDHASEQGWTVFDSSGFIVARLDVGSGPLTAVGVAGIGRNFIALRSMDSDHAVYLEFYRIRP